ncbi:MAG: ABC transporter ATP-binding protein [Thermoplasmata archaeon]|nr:ABC transporter ATP-binding protein [Thermoplasmata archaeon]
MAPPVDTRGLTKWYGLVLGVNDVDLIVSPGLTAIIGPNGAGKSTFLKLATGQLRPSGGGIWLYGEPVWNNPGLMARIGYCPEQDAFYRRMTGYEFVTTLLGLSGYTRADSEAMADDALREMGMAGAMDRRISGYSKGMRQRVKVAQAIAHDPDLLILDEPLSGTDPVGRVRVLDAIRRRERDGKDVLLSSHILHDIERVTRNIVLIDRGRVIAQGDVHEIRDLIDRHPHVVRIRTREARRLAMLLAGDPNVASLDVEDGTVVVRTPRPDEFYASLPAVLSENRVPCTEVQSPDDNLDAVFKYLVERDGT